MDLSFDQIKKGDKRLFRSFFELHYNSMLNFAFKIVRNQEAAEEIVQEMFLYIWEKKESINITTSLSAYMYSGIKNRCINYVKFELPKSMSSVEINENISVFEKESNETDAEYIKAKVDDAISKLPTKCKEIFILSRYAGLTYNEIAEELEVSVKTVENQISIALKKLREELKPLLKRND